MSVSIAVCVLGWFLGWLALGRPRPVSSVDCHADAPQDCAIVIPARDEESSIARLLGDLRSDDALSGVRVVVVDDHSTDRTVAVASAFDGVDVVSAPALPEHWTGKSWACHTGVEALRGGRVRQVVFLDADVRIRPGALGRACEEQRRSGGLLSVQPWHETDRWYEQLSALFNVIAVMGTGTGHGSNASGAFGPVMITSLADYDHVGGHRSVRSDVVEDLALAARYRDAERPVRVLEGGPELSFRMYPEGVGQLAEGWTKNFALGAGSTPLLRLAAIVVWVTALGSAALAVVEGVQGQLAAVWAVGLYGSFVAQLEVMYRKVGRFKALTSLLYPVGLVFFVLVFLRSLWRTHVRHSVTWRGRTIPIARQRS